MKKTALVLFFALGLGLGFAHASKAQDGIFKIDDKPETPTTAPTPPQPTPPSKPAAPKKSEPVAPPPSSATPPVVPIAPIAPIAVPRPFERQLELDSVSALDDKPSWRVLFWGIIASVVTFLAAFTLAFYGWKPAMAWVSRQEDMFDRVLRRELLMDVAPRTALIVSLAGGVLVAAVAWMALGPVAAVVAGAVAPFAPGFVLRHMIRRRLDQLNHQLPDGLTSLSSGVRAGLNLVQAMQLLVRNSRGPIQQEFAQILREYEMGMDLNQAMRNAANRIGSPLYRLTFTAIEMHRIRGGDSGESMDRICEAVREIQRLEGKLDAVTSQSRAQATMLTFMPVVILLILMLVAPAQTNLLFESGPGKLTLVGVAGAVLVARWWIHKIMQIDI